MFTGIIENVGTVSAIKKLGGGVQISITAPENLHLKIGDSISVNGCCQTVVECSTKTFSVIAVEETLKKTNFGQLRKTARVNLERPMKADGRFGGHFVLGHVDCVATVKKIEKRKTSRMFWLSVPRAFRRLLVPVGSVGVNGVSLTVAQLTKDTFGVSIIPHTDDATTFATLTSGDIVNIEFDVIGKYVQRLMQK